MWTALQCVSWVPHNVARRNSWNINDHIGTSKTADHQVPPIKSALQEMLDGIFQQVYMHVGQGYLIPLNLVDAIPCWYKYCNVHWLILSCFCLKKKNN